MRHTLCGWYSMSIVHMQMLIAVDLPAICGRVIQISCIRMQKFGHRGLNVKMQQSISTSA